MKRLFWLPIFLVFSLSLTNCENDDGFDNVLESNEVNDFIYRGLNQFYLYKDDVPDLANNRFNSREDRTNFISRGGEPEAFFERLTIASDRFSFIINDFEVLEQSFRGTSLSSGMKFNINEVENNRYIVITDIVKGSPADNAGIKRGMIFNRINGNLITVNNTSILFRSISFSISEARFSNGNLVDVNNTISLTRVEVTENPIATTSIIEEEGHKIGYLQYNGFTSSFEEQLNNEFAVFKAANLTDFVLDLRYNGGGAVITANSLCGMITGNLSGQVFNLRQWNSDNQKAIQNDDPESLIDRFIDKTTQGTTLNSLGLNKIYIITTKERTASSSELVINSLKPYIDVVVIGDAQGTVGKAQASRTVYDSRSFSRSNINPAHTYAMQPLIFETVNKNGEGVPKSGIIPDIIAKEDEENLGVLGDPSEPLFRKAIDNILGKDVQSAKRIHFNNSTYIGNEAMFSPVYQRMY